MTDKNPALLPDARRMAVAQMIERELAARGRTSQFVLWSASFARAYIYGGEWVADCPQEDCKNTEYVEDKLDRQRGVAGTRGQRKDTFYCSYCHTMASSIHWPKEADELMEVLERRPLPHTRNWYPEGHLTALKFGLRDGETVAELLEENSKHGID